MLQAGRFGVDLTEEVHIHSVIDGNEVIQLGDHLHVVGIIHRGSHHVGVFLNVVIELLGTGSERVHLTALIQRLAAAAELAGAGHIHETVHIHLRVNAQILQIGLCNQRTDGIGHTADAKLKAGAVGDLLDDHLGHLAIHLRGRRTGAHSGNSGVLPFHHHVHVLDVDLRAGKAVDPGHILIDFHNDSLGPIQHIRQMRSGQGKAEVAVGVHRRYLKHGHIHLRVAVTVETGQLRIAHGAEKAHALADDLPIDAAAMPGVPCKVLTGVIRLADLRHPHGDAAPDLHIIKLVLPCSQSLIQCYGMVAAPAVIHPVAGLDHFHRFFGGGQLLLIQFLIIHSALSSIIS